MLTPPPPPPDLIPADARRRPFRATRLAVGLLIAAVPWTFAADADAQTLPVLSIDSPSVVEGDSGSTNLNFTVTLSASSTSQVTVAYADAGTGTATSGTDYTALTAGMLTFAAGTTSRTITVSVTGDTSHESHETVVVTLSNPTNATVSATAGSGTGTIRDDEGLTLSVNSPTVAEGDSGSTNLNFTVSLSAASTQNVNVIFGITGGTATAGTDYTTSLTNNRIRLRFRPGQTSKTITLAVQGDTLDEPDETVLVALSGASFNARITTGTGTGTITDDDPLPTLSIDSPSVTEGDSGSTDMIFTISLSAASGREVRMAYGIYPGDGTATANTDFTGIDGFRFFTFAPGETSKTFTVEVLGDTDPEADETVGIRLAAGPANAVLGGNGRGVGTITDDDIAFLRTGPASVAEGDSGSTNLNFTVSLAAASGKTVTVDYADTGRGTATSGTDYTALAAGTLTIAPGDTSGTITVEVTGDEVVERPETVLLTLSNPTNARFLIASMASLTGTIRDDDGFPVANAGADQTVSEGATVTLSGSGSDPDGTPVSGYRWTQTAGPAVTLTSATTATTSFTAPTGLAADETLRFSLVVTAGFEGGSDSVDILVNAANPNWTAEAGPNQTVEEDDAVTLSGRTLSGGADLTLQGVMQPGYSWRHTSGGGSTVRLTGAATASPRFTAPNLLADATLTFTLTVTVGNDTMTDTVDVTVQADNDDPAANAGPDQTVYEGGAVTLPGRGSDPEGESLSYSWSQTEGPNVTLTGALSPTARFTAPLVTSDVTLTFTLTVTAGGATATDTVAVTVEPLVLMANAGPDQVVDEGDAVRLDGTGSTAPLGAGPLIYSWSQTGGSPSVTLTGATTATPSFTAPSGLTADVTLTFTLTVTVGGEGAASETDTVEVTVEWIGPVGAPTVLTADAGEDRTVDGGDAVRLDGSGSTAPPGEELRWSWRQTGGGPSVTLTGATTATPSFTAPDVTSNVTLTFTLTVTAGGDSVTDTVDVTVTPRAPGTPVNRPPAITLSGDRTYRQGERVSPFIVAASDPDGDAVEVEVVGLPPGLRHGGGLVEGTVAADAAAQVHRVTVTASDGVAAPVRATFTVTVTAPDREPDRPPTGEAPPDLRPSFAGVPPVSRQYRVGRPAAGSALPAAAGGDRPLRYELTPAPPAGLRFDGGSRTLTGTPTAEQRPAPWTLTATDADGDTATLEVTMAVLDPPVVTGLRLVSQPAAGDTYGYGEAVAAEVAFSEPVEVAGAPTLGLTVGSAVRTMRLTGAEGPRLRFGYRVSETDLDEDGVSVSADALALGGGRITDALGTAAELGHAGLAGQAGHRVDGRPRAVGTLRTVTVVLGGAAARVELSGAFRGAETYAAAVADGSLAAVEVDGSSAVVTGLAEGTTTVTVTGRNAGGSAEQRFGVVVTASAAEREVMVSTLAGVGRSLLAGASATVGRRLDGSGGGGAPEAQASLAGRTLPLAGGPASAAGRTAWLRPEAGTWSPAAASAAPALDRPRAAARRAAVRAGLTTAQGGRLTGEELLFGSAFTFSGGGTGQAAAEAGPGAGGGLRWTAWGAGDRQSFQGTAGSGATYDGRPATAAAGVDVERGRLLAGVAVARSVADANYAFRDAAEGVSGQGAVATRLVTAQPYARWALDERTSVWGVFGAGWGRAEVARSVTAAAESADLAVLMGLGGVRRELGPAGGLELALRGDVGGAWLETGGGGGGLLAGRRVAVHQSRLGLEIGRTFGTGLTVRPFAAVSGRYDGGAGATGTGLEVAGGLRASDGAGRVEVEASGRVLALHTESGYRERGVSVRARLTPGGDPGRGLSVEVTPRWGAPQIGAETLWRDQALGAAAGGGRPETGALDARVGYGLGLLAPFAEMGWAEDAQRQRLGLRVGQFGDAVDVEVTGERYALLGRPTDHRFSLIGRIGFGAPRTALPPAPWMNPPSLHYAQADDAAETP